MLELSPISYTDVLSNLQQTLTLPPHAPGGRPGISCYLGERYLTKYVLLPHIFSCSPSISFGLLALVTMVLLKASGGFERCCD